MLEKATKHTRMVTEYDLGSDGPIADGQSLGERIRVTRVVVESYDTGYTHVEVKGVSVTKSGKDKATRDYFYADQSVVEAVERELEAM